MNKFIFAVSIIFFATMGCCTAVAVGKANLSPPEEIEEEVFESADVNRVIQKFYTEWVKEFNNNEEDFLLKDHLIFVEVEFVKEIMMIKNGFYMDGTPFPPEGAPCSGVVVGIEHVKVWIRKSPYRISKTSLVHELVHVSLKLTQSTFDSDHLGDKYEAWTKKHTAFIKRLNTDLRSMSL